MTDRRELLALAAWFNAKVGFDVEGFVETISLNGKVWGKGASTLIGFAEAHRPVMKNLLVVDL